MKKAVFFDLDGTILDTLPDIDFYINQMLSYFGYRTLDRSIIRKKIGHGAKKLVIDCVDEKLTDEQLTERLNYYNSIYTRSDSPRTKLFNGIGELLIKIKENGYIIGILTNKPQETTDAVYEKYLKKYNFDVVVGHVKGEKVKPDPTVFNKILSDLGVDKENAIFVGDGETDIQLSINACVKGIAVLWGYRDFDDLIGAGATSFASSVSELLNLILNK